ncbi:MAG: hypothetical protein ACHQ1D_00615 [Nitrososphaerales archaeon]
MYEKFRGWYHRFSEWLFPLSIKPRYLCKHAEPGEIMIHSFFEAFCQFIETKFDPEFYEENDTIDFRGETEYIPDVWLEIYDWFNTDYVDYISGQGEYGDLLEEFLISREEGDKEEEERLMEELQKFEGEMDIQLAEAVAILCLTKEAM